MDGSFLLSEALGRSSQHSTAFQLCQNQMHVAQNSPLAISSSQLQAQVNFPEVLNQQNTQNLLYIHNGNVGKSVENCTVNGRLVDNDTSFQSQHQQMAVSSPSVSSTVDFNGGLGMSSGQNGIKHQQYSIVDGFPQQHHPDGLLFNIQQLNSNGVDQQHPMVVGQHSIQSQQHPSLLGGAMANAPATMKNGFAAAANVRFALPSTGFPLNDQGRAFLFNSDMANKAVKSKQKGEDMSSWHLKNHPSTSRVPMEQQQQKTINNCKTSQSPTPQAGSRALKRKASAQITEFQPHSMSLSPRDLRSSFTPAGNPQSLPVAGTHFEHQPQNNCIQNEFCDSSTNGDADMFKRSSSRIAANITVPTYIQSVSFAQMEENPLKKMEIMASKTLNEPSGGGRILRISTEESSQQLSVESALDISKQEKMRKLQEIEKSLLPFAADTSPSFPHHVASSFPDATHQLRPSFFAPPHGGHVMQAQQFASLRPLMGSFPMQHTPMRMTMLSSQQQLCNSMAEQAGLMQQNNNNTLTPGGSLEFSAQQHWLPQS